DVMTHANTKAQPMSRISLPNDVCRSDVARTQISQSQTAILSTCYSHLVCLYGGILTRATFFVSGFFF
ncbi:uncharacterized protein SPAPADRAFT_59274, partial [Spathaspora passalidarum NRRL Y-27907]